MFMTLLIVTFAVAFATASVVVRILNKPIDAILNRVIQDEISSAWSRYLKFATYVIGIGGGVRVGSFERYLTPAEPSKEIASLTLERWALEIYQVIMGTLENTVTFLFFFFIFGLIAFVVVRAFELRKAKPESSQVGERV